MNAQIMAIINVTPDSFYAGSRLLQACSEDVDCGAVRACAESALLSGADILDIGGCSTRPGSVPVDSTTEWRRLSPALETIRSSFPSARLSIDTFRPETARLALSRFGKMIINDVSGGCEAMYSLVREHEVPYVWTLRGDTELPSRSSVMEGIEVILDPGFGFTGGVENDYACLRRLASLRRYGRPVLAGVSRKSMVYKPLDLTPESCLTATQVLQFYALEQGATILRTHDVVETAQTIQLFEKIMNG